MRILLQSILLVGLMGCNSHCEEPKPLDPIDQLPPITQTGENTFGCLVNGEAYVVTNTNNHFALHQAPQQIQFGGGYIGTGQISFILNDTNLISEGIYKLDTLSSDKQGRGSYIIGFETTPCIFETKFPISGEVEIDHIDRLKFIVSGTFNYDAVSVDCQDTVHITDGRFDMQYTP